jgi:DNA-binding PadR family transcriptional regulator
MTSYQDGARSHSVVPLQPFKFTEITLTYPPGKKHLTARRPATTISRIDISARDIQRRMTKQVDPESLLPLRPSVFHILLALSDGDLHGYGIMQEVAEHTAGQIRLGPGTLYGTIKRLLIEKLIVEVDERPDPELDDERRRYYRSTDFGQRVLKAEVRRISKMVSVAQKKRLIARTRS